MELGYDGNAATVLPAEEVSAAPAAPKTAAMPKRHLLKRHEKETTAKKLWAVKPLQAAAVPKVVIAILVVAVGISVMLMSHAKLVLVNDQVVELRSELSQLQDEGTKLKTQYALTYDLQEIETQMRTSGRMIKIQNWQTYTLELAEPDAVEYYQYSSGLGDRAVALVHKIVSAAKAYF